MKYFTQVVVTFIPAQNRKQDYKKWNTYHIVLVVQLFNLVKIVAIIHTVTSLVVKRIVFTFILELFQIHGKSHMCFIKTYSLF